MKRAASFVLAVCLALAILTQTALAYNFYLIPDSNARRLTENELWNWDYDALGYILNEIFARYGMPFKRDGKYYPYFTQQDWYHENPGFTYSDVQTGLEWDNERLVKGVRQQMKSSGTLNPDGRSIEDAMLENDSGAGYHDGGVNIANEGFPCLAEYHFSARNGKLPVYSGPGEYYYRGAKGKAYCSTNEEVYIGGWEGQWLLVSYSVDAGGMRIGYVSAQALPETVNAPSLMFEDRDYTVINECSLTDDPFWDRRTLTSLKSGDHVIYLAEVEGWAYVDVPSSDVGTIRGFIPFSCIAPE